MRAILKNWHLFLQMDDPHAAADSVITTNAFEKTKPGFFPRD